MAEQQAGDNEAAGAEHGRRPEHGGKTPDERMELAIGMLLRLGVLLAAAVVLAGGVIYQVDHRGEQVNYSRFVAHPITVRHPAELLRPNAMSVLELGIVLLIATPIARVMFALVAFLLERDRLYVAISATVLAVLLYGMLRGG